MDYLNINIMENLLNDEGKFILTKELKENWLTALKSGIFSQCRDILKRNNNNFCCLGVLAEIHPLLTITENGEDCLHNIQNVGYKPFYEMGILSIIKNDNSFYFGKGILIDINDNSFNEGIRDYSEVIPFIENLPTV